MKKYVEPVIKVHKIQSMAILAGSDGQSGLAGANYRQNIWKSTNEKDAEIDFDE